MATVRRRARVGSLRDERTPIGLMIGMIPSWIISMMINRDDKDNDHHQHEENDTIMDRDHNNEQEKEDDQNDSLLIRLQR